MYIFGLDAICQCNVIYYSQDGLNCSRTLLATLLRDDPNTHSTISTALNSSKNGGIGNLFSLNKVPIS